MPTFAPDTRTEVSDFCQRLRTGRGVSGRCSVCTLMPPLDKHQFAVDLVPLVDAFAEQNGMYQLGERWCEVNGPTAEWILFQLFEVDLAYNTRCMERHEARNLATTFMRLVSPNPEGGAATMRCRYFTNGMVVPGPPIYTVGGREIRGWMPATDATFDTGSIMISPQHIGLVWFADED